MNSLKNELSVKVTVLDKFPLAPPVVVGLPVALPPVPKLKLLSVMVLFTVPSPSLSWNSREKGAGGAGSLARERVSSVTV